jgi:exodeoxyribonuclease-5
VLCWRNATRWKLIERMRAKAGKPAGVPVAGDRVMCLVNNKKDLGIFNGQQFEVLDVNGDALLLAEIGADGPDRWISAFPEGFAGLTGEATLKDRRAFRGTTGAFTFADAITVHKAQGSEWGSVYLIDETPLMISQMARRQGQRAAELEARRWLYTGCTRAKDTLTLARLRG